MSRFIEGVIATATGAGTGMVTGEPGEATRRTWGEVHGNARRIAGGLIAGGLQPGAAVAVLAGLPAQIAPVQRKHRRCAETRRTARPPIDQGWLPAERSPYPLGTG